MNAMHLEAGMELIAPVCEHQIPLEITEASVNIKLKGQH